MKILCLALFLASFLAPAFAATVGGLEVGAKVDEPVFAPNGAGVTLHVAPNGDDKYKGAALGSTAHPFGSVEAAVTRANALQRGLITAQTALKTGEFPLPMWMKLVRKGDSIRAFVRSDDVSEWAPVGGEVPLKMGASASVGLFVNNESRKGDATASFDKITLNGQPISPNWNKKNLTTTLTIPGGGSFSVEGETVKVAGRGYEQKGDHVVGENGVFVFQPLPGDGEFVARLNGVTWVQDEAKKGFFGVAGVMIAEQAAANSRLMRLCAMGNGSASATTPARLQLSTRLNAPTPAQDVKIRIAPGTYRLSSTLNFAGADLEGRKKPLVIEGAPTPGQNDVILSGSQTAGWEAPTWKLVDAAKNIYSHEWKNNWGFSAGAWSSPLSRRREMLFVGGQRLTPVLLENFEAARPKPLEYKGFQDPISTLPEGAFGVAEFGPNDPASASVATKDGKKTFAELFAADPTRAAIADTIFLRLPKGMMPAQFQAAPIEVSTAQRAIIADNRDNFVLRNLTVQHFWDTYGALAVDTNNNWSERPLGRNKNWVLDNVHFDDNRGIGAQLWWVDGLTLQNSTFDRNGDFGMWLLGERIDARNISNSFNNQIGALSMNFLVRNARFENSRFNHNGSRGLRMDHVAENIDFIGCQFNDNLMSGAMFETAIGPVSFRNCEFKDTRKAPSNEFSAGISLSTVHGFTFDGCTFSGNADLAMMLYPRERAHSAVVAGQDELPNNMDVGKFSTFGVASDRPYLPVRQKPANEIRNLTVTNSTFSATNPNDLFFAQSRFKRNEAYARTIGEELTAFNNTYWHPNNPAPFRLPFDKKATFAEWKKQGTGANFEAGSFFGDGKNPLPAFKPAPILLAEAANNTKGTVSASGVRYDVENLKFSASQPVELLSAPDGSKTHKLHAVQVGDFGDHLTYTLSVPAAGDYFVNVRYLQTSGPFQYLGYAQLSIDEKPVGSWWDEHGLTPKMMDAPLEKVALAAGDHQFRFEPVWRNGYGSADYDITVSRIELLKAPVLRPATGKATGNGLNYRYYENEGAEWTRLPDFKKLTPAKSGETSNFDLSIRGRDKAFGVVFEGFLEVPADGVYTFYTLVNDGANLYLDGDLVLDNDGVHDGEKTQPWEKPARVALQAGLHPLRVEYFESGGKGRALEVSWEGPGIKKQAIPAQHLKR